MFFEIKDNMRKCFNFILLQLIVCSWLNAQTSTSTNSTSEIQWASKVIGFSSEFKNIDKPQTNQYRAVQVLGKPNKLPAIGQSPVAWSPERQSNPDSEWIKVGFEKPMNIEQVVVAENFNPGSITHVYVYDISDKEYLIYRNLNVAPLTIGGRMFQIFQKTDFPVASVKIVMNTSKVPGFNQIDAIGISNNSTPIVAKINLAEKMDIKSKPENLGANINSVYQEIAPMVTPDGKSIYFTRSKHPQNVGNPEKQDVWAADLQNDGSFAPAKNLGPPINTTQHNSSFSITPDGNTMLLNNIYNSDGTLEKGLSITRKDKNGNWSIPEKVIIDDYYNRNAYSEFCLSQDGKILLMTVQRNDAYGGKDIYFSRLKPDNSWTAPQNLGPIVNTAASETSPFLASDGKTLYYSTGGFSGYGANDIFVTRRLDETWQSWSEPQNLGPEINTPEWDAYFSISAKADYAYYTSYSNSMGDSDIFRVKLTEKNKPEPVALIQGKVYNAKTKQPIKANILYEFLPDGANAGNASSNPQTGDYKVVLPLKKKYGILAESKGFLSIDENIDLTNYTDYVEINKDLYLVPIEEGATVRLNNIFFVRTQFSLLPESFPELNRLIKALQDNPGMVIQLEGHTEIFGRPKDQLKLAENRVKSVKRYLVENGQIDEKRIKLRSFGGTKPVCRELTEECRALNRRVEIRILQN
jgi:outer membrane protein OmpA-like peptidoglycan-associated protein